MTRKAPTADPAAVTLAELHALYYGLPDPTPEALGEQAVRTRRAIVEKTRELLVRIDYPELKVGDIATACGISRAGFYAYFKDKRDVVALLAAGSYRECLRVIGLWDALPRDPDADAVAGWVREYFAFQDVHGLFNGAATISGPADPEAVAMAQHLRTNVAGAMGEALRQRQAEPTAGPQALGMVALAALNRAWLGPRVTRLPVDRADLVRTLAVLLRTLIAARPATPTERGAPPAPAPDDPALAAARALFVDRGYARPTDTEIAAACGTTRTELARSGGRSALFGRVGAAALDAVAASVDRYGGLPHPCSPADAARWIEEHYAVLDRHGGFLFNQGFTASTDQRFHQQSYASLMRAMWGLGTRLRGRQAVPTDAPDALGLAVLGMITDSWFYARGQGLQVEAGELIGVLATATVDLLGRE